KLSDIGITKDESSRWQKLAKMPEKQFEEKLAGVKTVMRAKTEGQKAKPRSRRPTETEQQTKARDERVVKLHDQGVSSKEIASKVGIVERGVHRILKEERIRRDGHNEPEI